MLIASGPSTILTFHSGVAVSPVQSLITSVISTARAANATIREFEIEQERNLVSFTVQARLIYDNVNSFDVLGYIRSTLQSYGYSPNVVTMSTSAQFPDVDFGLNNESGVDCGSIYGDSATLFFTSSLMGAIAGNLYGGLFGLPSGQKFPHNLACYDSEVTADGMESLPPGIGYSQPQVVDVHAYPCITLIDQPAKCNQTADATNTAQTFYNDLWTLLWYRGLTGGLAVFGESSIINYSCDPEGLPPSDTGAQWAVNGYRSSTLFSKHASQTVFQPFNNLSNACYANPINIGASPYNPQ
jgi:hypothetical protein